MHEPCEATRHALDHLADHVSVSPFSDADKVTIVAASDEVLRRLNIRPDLSPDLKIAALWHALAVAYGDRALATKVPPSIASAQVCAAVLAASNLAETEARLRYIRSAAELPPEPDNVTTLRGGPSDADG